MYTTSTSTCPFVDATQLGAVRLSSVQPEKTRWLWPGIIPLGRVTLLASDPGLGKSLLTLDIAARVSTGAAWPDAQVKSQELRDESQQSASGFRLLTLDSKLSASVLLLTAEDDLADTIRPRLEALGADCDKILAISNVPGENSSEAPRAFALNRDLARLTNLLNAIPDCRLLIIDPISAYLGNTNEHANVDIQTLLTALVAIARERDLAVIIVSHLRKKEGAAIHRTMGSLAFVAAARAVWTICKDPQDANKRLLLPVKSNLAPNLACLTFSIEANADNGAPVVRWSPDSVQLDTDTVVALGRSVGRPNIERQYAIDWLRNRLANGPQSARDIRAEADAHGIGYGTLRRAFRELGGEAFREGPFPYGEWKWKLPGVDAQNTGGEFCASTTFLDEFSKMDNYVEALLSDIPEPKFDLPSSPPLPPI